NSALLLRSRANRRWRRCLLRYFLRVRLWRRQGTGAQTVGNRPETCRKRDPADFGGNLRLFPVVQLLATACQTGSGAPERRLFHRVLTKETKNIDRKMISSPIDAPRILMPCFFRMENRP